MNTLSSNTAIKGRQAPAEAAQSTKDTALLDSEFSRLMRPHGANMIHLATFEKGQSELNQQDLGVKALAKELRELLGHVR